ncbi:MAG: hypothetical protein JWL77_6788 [Chthonomonadaceae bacterium]|nr:hypothetical protein [Chthonomonadaceae bacterium]
MKVKIEIAPAPNLIKQYIVISEEDNPRNYLCITTHSAKASIATIIAQLQEYLNEN